MLPGKQNTIQVCFPLPDRSRWKGAGWVCPLADADDVLLPEAPACFH